MVDVRVSFRMTVTVIGLGFARGYRVRIEVLIRSRVRIEVLIRSRVKVGFVVTIRGRARIWTRIRITMMVRGLVVTWVRGRGKGSFGVGFGLGSEFVLGFQLRLRLRSQLQPGIWTPVCVSTPLPAARALRSGFG